MTNNKDGEYKLINSIDTVMMENLGIDDIINFIEDDLCLQIRICRVSGSVDKVLTNLEGAINYNRLISRDWYKEVFHDLQVNIRDLKIDLIPEDSMLAVYRAYSKHLIDNVDLLVSDESEARRRLESFQKKALQGSNDNLSKQPLRRFRENRFFKRLISSY